MSAPAPPPKRQELSAVRSLNDRCLERMATPADFVEALPRSVKALNLGEHMRRALEREGAGPQGKNDPEYGRSVFETLAKDGVAVEDRMAMLEAVGALEKAALVWVRLCEKKAGGAACTENRQAANARAAIAAVRSAMPGLGQTPLETSKLAHNRDVGSAVLEALSRVVESRIAMMAQMVEEVLSVGRRSDEASRAVGLVDKAYLEWHAQLTREAEMLT